MVPEQNLCKSRCPKQQRMRGGHDVSLERTRPPVATQTLAGPTAKMLWGGVCHETECRVHVDFLPKSEAVATGLEHILLDLSQRSCPESASPICHTSILYLTYVDK